MTSKVTGKQAHVLTYFSSVFAIIAWVGLMLFIMQMMAIDSAQAETASEQPGLLDRFLAPHILYLQLFILSILLPGCLFCSYLTLKLKMSSLYYRNALKMAAAAMLPVAPIVLLLGIYTLWLSFYSRDKFQSV